VWSLGLLMKLLDKLPIVHKCAQAVLCGSAATSNWYPWALVGQVVVVHAGKPGAVS
jgi:hypothetical protein